MPAQFDTTPVRVVIAAVQSPFRQLLRKQLESEPRIEVVGDAPDAHTAYSLVRRLRPDILVIECPLNREFSKHYSTGKNHFTVIAPGIVVLIASPRIEDIVEALELGARGVVLRTSLPLTWRTGLQNILAGQHWVEDKSVMLLVDALRGFLVRTDAMPFNGYGLTARELEIALRISAGRSNKEVGQEFSICERTVKHHLTNIFRKVGVSSRLELAVFVLENTSPRTPLAAQIEPGEQRDVDSNGRRRLFAVPDR